MQLLDAWIAGSDGLFSYRRPQAGGVAFVRYAMDVPSETFSERLRQEESVFVVAGSWFGIDQHIRIGTGGKPDHLKEALARASRFAERRVLAA